MPWKSQLSTFSIDSFIPLSSIGIFYRHSNPHYSFISNRISHVFYSFCSCHTQGGFFLRYILCNFSYLHNHEALGNLHSIIDDTYLTSTEFTKHSAVLPIDNHLLLVINLVFYFVSFDFWEFVHTAMASNKATTKAK
jgi:hypothetical protein